MGSSSVLARYSGRTSNNIDIPRRNYNEGFLDKVERLHGSDAAASQRSRSMFGGRSVSPIVGKIMKSSRWASLIQNNGIMRAFSTLTATAPAVAESGGRVRREKPAPITLVS
jgi:hypothetical protein